MGASIGGPLGSTTELRLGRRENRVRPLWSARVRVCLFSASRHLRRIASHCANLPLIASHCCRQSNPSGARRVSNPTREAWPGETLAECVACGR